MTQHEFRALFTTAMTAVAQAEAAYQVTIIAAGKAKR